MPGGLAALPPRHVAQLWPFSGPPLAVLGTFLLAWGFYGLTAHIAARYLLGDVPIRPAVGVGAVLALVALPLRPFGPATVIAISLAVDVGAIKALYRVDWRLTAMVALVHYAVSAILGITLFNLVRLVGTAPVP